MRKLIAGIIVVAVAIALAMVVINGQEEQPVSRQTKSDNTAGSRQNSLEPNTIEMDANGFSPQTLTVKKGTAVSFKNIDTEEHWPASDPHPVHTDYSALDPRRPVRAGETWTFTFSETGTFDMHDHLFPAFKTAVVVE